MNSLCWSGTKNQLINNNHVYIHGTGMSQLTENHRKQMWIFVNVKLVEHQSKKQEESLLRG